MVITVHAGMATPTDTRPSRLACHVMSIRRSRSPTWLQSPLLCPIRLTTGVPGSLPLARSHHSAGRRQRARHQRAAVARDTSDQPGSSVRLTGTAPAIFLGDPLSSSRAPRLGRPCGPLHAIGYTDARPAATPSRLGACREDGDRTGRPERPRLRGFMAWAAMNHGRGTHRRRQPRS